MRKCHVMQSMMVCLIVMILGTDLSETACPEQSPHDCTCQDISLECINTNLSKIPSDLPAVSDMTFEGNHFQTIVDFPYSGLQRLSLYNNEIQFIYETAFHSMSELKYLTLAENKISRLSKKHFEGLSNLTHLILMDNPLHHLDSDIFTRDTTPNMEILNFANCSLFAIDDTAMYGLSKLFSIDLSHNMLEWPPMLTAMTTLKSITLSHNEIKTLSSMTEIERYAFVGLASLEIIHMDHNQLEYLEPDAFRGPTALKKLYLNNNRIASIAMNTFKNLTNLKLVDVSYNNLHVMTSEHVDTSTMSSLVIHHNPWYCTCRNKWMRTDHLVLRFNPPDSMICSMPKSESGNSLFDANVHTFDCPDPHHGFHSQTVGLAVGLLVAIFIAVFGSVLLYKLVVKKKLKRHASMNATSSYSRVQDSVQGLVHNEEL